MENVKNAEIVKLYECSNCLFITRNKTDYTRHIFTPKHKKRVIGSVFNQKNADNPTNTKIYECSVCLYISSNKNDYNRHISTPKHQTKTTKLEVKPETLHCNCGKQFKTNNGLWKHNKKCKLTNQITNEPKQQLFTDEMFMELIKQNKELQTLLLEQQKMVMEQNNKICSLIQTPTNNNTNL